MQGLYGQGKLEVKGPFSLWSGTVRETCNGQGKIAFCVCSFQQELALVFEMWPWDEVSIVFLCLSDAT